ncbi:MAG: hypothetical protein ROO76_11435 [Terriglobia bacterium]|nr:hypothetical protein [Terriglobia bacterium]
MLITRLLRATVLISALLLIQTNLAAQGPITRCEQAPGSLGQLNRNQKKLFLKSQDMLAAGRYADAFRELRGLLAQLPQHTPIQSVMAEMTAEAALFAGDRAYAITLLKPLQEHDGSDCLARTLLARAYAENGQPAEREAEISALTELHNQAPDSPIGKLDFFLLEHQSLKSGGTVGIWYALRPWGVMKTHLYAQVLDPSGKATLTIQLNSDDGLQVYFKEKHPDLAAKGERQFSLDVAQPDGTGGAIQFFDGAPTYDAVRERILAIAERTENPGARR